MDVILIVDIIPFYGFKDKIRKVKEEQRKNNQVVCEDKYLISKHTEHIEN